RWAVHELRLRWRPLVTYQLAIGALGVVAFSPLATLALRGILRASGKVAVNNFDLVGFFLSPVGLLFLAVALVLFLLVFYLQQAGLTLLTAASGGTRVPRIALARVAARLHDLVPLGLWQLGALLLALLPFAAVIAVVVLPLLRLHDINYYLHEQPPEWRRALVIAGVAGAGFAATALWLVARFAAALQLLLLDGVGARAALAGSWRMTAGKGWRIVRILGAWWLSLFLVNVLLVGAVGLVARPLAAAMGSRVGLVLLAVTLFLSAGIFVGFLWTLAGNAGHALLANRFYRRHGERPAPAPPPNAEAQGIPLTLGTVGLGALAVWVVVTLIVLDRVRKVEFREDTLITAHRGSSLEAPENSMAAIRQAIADGADYAEIDVQRTLDGRVVLLHDGDLMRMAGVGRRINQLTVAALDSIDIGVRKNPKYAGEHVPTLDAVLDTAKGRLKLNIELKYNWPDPLLGPEVVRIVREHGYVDGVTITSLDFKSLVALEALAPEFQTGMIVTKSVGNVAKLPVDFLSLNQAAVNNALLARARSAGKEVHVWTVNTPGDMERMMERGVDNIITDHPAVAVAVRAQRAQLSTPEKVAIRLRRLLTS
ncbi:MAG TPA: glycerophosphodiester phosphodiesterase family protein, partial [Gemmatimonadales bacterium]|nr:glycerophosphodiester phosphodiesterase family protein [Gemmatimonadales bacterium]